MPVYEYREEADKVILPNDTIVTAEIVSIKEQEKTSKEGKQYKKLLWTFAIQEPGAEYDGQYVYGDTFPEFRSGSEFEEWTREVMAQDEAFEKGFKINTDLLVGMQCRLRVGLRSYEKNGETKSTNFVAEVMRSRSAMSATEEPF